MKKIISKGFAAFAIGSFFILSSGILYAQKKVGFSSGNVSVVRGGVESPLKSGAILKDGDKIKTAAQSRAEIIDGESRLWLRENSEIEIKSPSRKDSVFSLIAGKVRAKVKLIKGSKFQVHSPIAVASVRGTDFSFDSDGQLVVFEGTVEFADKALSQTALVEAGNIAKLENGLIKKEVLTPEQVTTHNQEWLEIMSPPAQESKGIIKGEGKDSSKDKDDLASELLQMRKEIRDMVREIRNDVIITRDFTNEMKQADIASGRTLIDRYGNLVRVEQQLLRPQNDTIQLLNITKRDTYRYNGFFGANNYKGTSGNRIDIAEVKLQFNKGLPSDITEWPRFFSDNDDVELNKITLSLSNRQDKIEIVTTRQMNAGEDEMKSEMNFYTKGTKWTVDEDYESHLWGSVYPDPDKDESVNELVSWGKSPDTKITDGSGTTKYISLWTETYGINNSGGLLSKNTFAEGGTNPFILLKEVAFQTVIFVKELDNPTNYTFGTDVTKAVKGDFFDGRNIDLVMTPDLFLSATTKLISKIGDILSASDSSDKTLNRSIGLLPL